MNVMEALKWLNKNKGWIDHYEVPNDVVETCIEALTELDRLQKFKATFDAYELSKKQDFIAYENWQECEKELSEYKQDIQNLIKIVLGSTTIAELEEEMKTMKEDDLKIAKIITKWLRSDEK